MSDQKMIWGHPRGLATLFFTEMWERFSYYGMRALLILFMTTAVVDGGLGFDDKTSGAIYGLYTMGVYLLALPGGWLADRLFGLKKSVWYGGIIIALGHFTMGLPGIVELLGIHSEGVTALDTNSFFLGLIFVVIGTGLLKPNVSAMVGDLYAPGDAKRDAGFSIFYMGINIGGFIAPILTGTLAAHNWHLGFGLAGFGMILGLIQYKMTQGYLGEIGDFVPPATEEERASNAKLKRGTTMVMIAVAVVVLLLFMQIIPFDAFSIADSSKYIIGTVTLLYLLYVIFLGGLKLSDQKKVVAIGVICIFSAIFWSGFEQAGSTLNLFGQRFTDRTFFGWEMPASYFQSVNSMFIIIFAPLVGALWVWLAKRNLEPNSPVKFSFGLILLGLGFLTMYFAAKIAASGDLAAPTWLLITYLLHTWGELSLSPVGLSLTTKLAPKKFYGQMMGVWFISVALGNLVAGLFAGEASGGDEEALQNMPDQYMTIVLLTLGAGGVIFLLSGVIRKKLMGDVR